MKSILKVISLALAFVPPAFAGIEWGFPDDTLSVAGTALGSPGSGTATINAGTYGSGWRDVNNPMSTWSTLGSARGASGLWDLGGQFNDTGTPGSIVLDNLAGSGLTTLNVSQWVQDPGGLLTDPYNGNLGFAVTGSISQTGLLTPVVPVTGVGWWTYAANFDSALVSGDMVTITASAGGAIIDQLTLVPEPATMIAGAILLIPFALSTWPILRRRRRR